MKNAGYQLIILKINADCNKSLNKDPRALIVGSRVLMESKVNIGSLGPCILSSNFAKDMKIKILISNESELQKHTTFSQ